MSIQREETRKYLGGIRTGLVWFVITTALAWWLVARLGTQGEGVRSNEQEDRQPVGALRGVPAGSEFLFIYFVNFLLSFS